MKYDTSTSRSPADGLPVDHSQIASRAGTPEEHVVQPVVAVHQALDPLGRGLPGQIGIEAVDQTLTDQALLRGDGFAVAVGEPGIQLGDQLLVQRRVAVEPIRVGEGLTSDHRSMQPAQLRQGQPRLFRCGAADFVTDDSGRGIVDEQGEDAGLGIVGGVEALRDRPPEARRTSE